jgi:flagellar basal-body rod modification protein FlgD
MPTQIPPPPVSGGFTPTTGVPAKPPPVDMFSSEGFLKLLSSQIRSQNPLEPMKDTEFVAQMAQFSQLEQITSVARDMKALTMSSQISQGASLIGKSVTYQSTVDVLPVTGTVQSLTFSAAGRSMSLIVDGVPVDVSLVTSVGA